MRGALAFDGEDPEEVDLARQWFRLWFTHVKAIKKTDIDGFIHIYIAEAPPEAIVAIPSSSCGALARYETVALAPPKRNPFPVSAKERQARRK